MTPERWPAAEPLKLRGKLQLDLAQRALEYIGGTSTVASDIAYRLMLCEGRGVHPVFHAAGWRREAITQGLTQALDLMRQTSPEDHMTVAGYDELLQITRAESRRDDTIS